MSNEIFNHLSVGVIIVGSDQNIRFCNRKAGQVFGFNPAAVMGKAYASVFFPLITDQRFKQLHKLPVVAALKTGQYYNYALAAINMQKQPLNLECSVSPIKNNNNQVIGVVELYTPSSERSGGTAAVNQQSQADAILSQFVSEATRNHVRVSHKANEIVALKRYRTVVFIDIVGFTTMAEKLDPHATVDVLNMFFRRVHGTIGRYKGDIDKFLGDALLITFDNGEQAVRCSTDIILMDLPIINSQVRAQYPEIQPLTIHCGVNSGWIIFGEFGGTGRKDFTVIGDDVNIAARIQGLSPPNEIFISGKTAGNLGEFRNLFEFAEYMRVKGKNQQITIYKLDPKKLKVNKRVFLYEKNKAVQQRMIEKLQNLGVNETTTADNHEQISERLGNKHETMFLGPSTAMNELQMIKKLTQQKGFKQNIMIPISKDVSPQSIAALEKMGIKTYIAYNEGEGLETAMGNAMRSQSLENIPKAEIAKEGEKTESLLGVEDGFAFRLFPNEIKITIEKPLPKEKIQALTNSIHKVWSIEYQGKQDMEITMNFDSMGQDQIDDKVIGSVLGGLSQHEKLASSIWKEKPVQIETQREPVKDLINDLQELYPVKLKG